MVIERVHGLRGTGMSLNERFSILASAAPDRVAMRQKHRPIGAFMNTNLNFRNRNIIEQIAKRLEQQARRQAVKQRLGMGPTAGLRRFGSESSLPGLRRSNSFSSINQDRSIKQRIGWRQSNGNLSRSASFSNLSGVSLGSRGSWGSWGGRPLRGFRRRGGGQRALRGRFRGGRQGVGRITRVPQRVFTRGPRVQGQQRVAARGTARGAARGGGRGRGRGTGGVPRNQQTKTVTKEELDAQLEQYMAGSKAALDKELDTYMKNAMDLE
ncbi:chromatin target of PRMT1 protein [Manduca sexta]|uniref:Chromatin target of PRMT1 protein C-terminal domain-containing protein n=1 Tax=Manduca sexta TaxID=7130 RepID=A0A921Z6A7_MANSE|nr:chromatin target of PRMT1 protein [Manduca sexta]KAG6451344.1 hypothetical protein O3G_MSEX007094 [Manduca sexta]